MKYFRDDQGAVWAFEADGSQDGFIPPELTAISKDEADALRAPAETWAQAKERALALLKTERAPILSVLDGLQSTAASKGLSALISGDAIAASAQAQTATEIESLKQALKDAPTTVDLSACETFEQMRQAGKAFYAQLAANASPDLRIAFNLIA